MSKVERATFFETYRPTLLLKLFWTYFPKIILAFFAVAISMGTVHASHFKALSTFWIISFVIWGISYSFRKIQGRRIKKIRVIELLFFFYAQGFLYTIVVILSSGGHDQSLPIIDLLVSNLSIFGSEFPETLFSMPTHINFFTYIFLVFVSYFLFIFPLLCFLIAFLYIFLYFAPQVKLIKKLIPKKNTRESVMKLLFLFIMSLFVIYTEWLNINYGLNEKLDIFFEMIIMVLLSISNSIFFKLLIGIPLLYYFHELFPSPKLKTFKKWFSSR